MRRSLRSGSWACTGLVLGLLVLPASGTAQQTGSITGRVTDAQTLQPLASAQVSIPELSIGALTQQNGRFVLVNVPAGTHTVTVQRIGYRTVTQTATVAAEQSVTLDFEIVEEALALDEIVVTGTPGGTQRRALGNTVTRVEAAAITEQVAIASMQDMLTARTPGLNFGRVSGSVGTGSNIQIRGTGSFSLGAQPLIYVDGVRIDNSNRAGPATNSAGFNMSSNDRGGGEVSILDDFNPEDIESIEVIKGPAAATLYGTEASAGVIQIITKKGNEGTPEFSVSIRQGANFMRDPAGRLGDQYACRSRTSPPCEEADIFQYNMYEEANRYISGEVPGPDGGRFFNWPTKNLYQYGHAQQYNLDVRGGTAAVRYFLSANYQDDEGAVWYNWDRTSRFRANVTTMLADNLTVDVSTGYLQGNARMADPSFREGGHWQDMLWNNGYYLLRINPEADPRRGGFQEHLPTDVANIEALRDYSRFTGSVTLNHNLGEWFTQRGIVGIDKGWEINELIYPIDTSGFPVYPQTEQGEHNYAKPVTTNFSLDYAASFRFRPVEWLSTTSSVGAQYYTETYETVDMQGFGYASPLSRSIDQTVIERLSLNHEYVENKSLGIYVQEELGLNDRLFLTGAVRFDDNSAFGADFDAQIYPKVSAAWVISEEGFWNVAPVNQLRLRAALGKAGRQPDVFAGTYIYGVLPGPGGTTALNPQQPGNTEVGPETSTELELGFDYALLDDRISGEFTYFRQRNEDALLGLAIPPNNGFPGSVQQNVGRIDNWGWEATLNASIYQSRNFSLDLALSGDHAANEIKDLGTYPGSTTLRVGYPYPARVVSTWIVDADWDDESSIRTAYGQGVSGLCDPGVPLGPTPQHGRVPGGELVNCLEAQGANLLLGPVDPTYSWSISPTISMLGNSLQVYAMAQGRYGGYGYAGVEQWAHEYNTTLASIKEDDPMWVLGDRLGDLRSKAIFDSDFWKLREVGARYNLPASWVARTGADRASIAVSARDLATLWRAQPQIYGREIGDPEFLGPGGFGNYYQQPPLSSVHATLRVTF